MSHTRSSENSHVIENSRRPFSVAVVLKVLQIHTLEPNITRPHLEKYIMRNKSINLPVIFKYKTFWWIENIACDFNLLKKIPLWISWWRAIHVSCSSWEKVERVHISYILQKSIQNITRFYVDITPKWTNSVRCIFFSLQMPHCCLPAHYASLVLIMLLFYYFNFTVLRFDFSDI